MAGIGDGSFETIFREMVRDLRLARIALAKARVPRYCTSAVRPDPSRLQPGTPLFETDTNRTIFVNATQDGYVVPGGGTTTGVTSGSPELATGVTYVDGRNNTLQRFGPLVAWNLSVVLPTTNNVGTPVATAPAGFLPAAQTVVPAVSSASFTLNPDGSLTATSSSQYVSGVLTYFAVA